MGELKQVPCEDCDKDKNVASIVCVGCSKSLCPVCTTANWRCKACHASGMWWDRLVLYVEFGLIALFLIVIITNDPPSLAELRYSFFPEWHPYDVPPYEKVERL